MDEAGNIYIALVANGQVAMFSYTPALALRWNRVESIPGATGVQSIAANSDGAIIALAGATVRAFHRLIEGWGRSGSVDLGPMGRLYWQRSMVWPGPNERAYPYLLAF